MLERKVFIREISSVNRPSARAVIRGEVPALAHEGRNHAMKPRADVSLALGLFAQNLEIFRRLRRRVRLQIHDDAGVGGAGANLHVKVHLGVSVGDGEGGDVGFVVFGIFDWVGDLGGEDELRGNDDDW